jgi:hypothetical protein
MQKKKLLMISFGLAAILVVGQISFAAGSNDGLGTDGMMSNSGMSNMMKMMEDPNMTRMMTAMNSPEGQKMMNACSTFMNSYDQNNKQ